MLEQDLEIVSLWNELFREFSFFVALIDTALPDGVLKPEPVEAPDPLIH
ncbi:hypothetical protein [Lichenicoccus sp.]